MAIDLSLFNNSVTTVVGHLTSFYGEEATLETYVICAKVKSPDIPGGSAINWAVNPGSEQLAGGLLREVVKAVEGNGDGAGQRRRRNAEEAAGRRQRTRRNAGRRSRREEGVHCA